MNNEYAISQWHLAVRMNLIVFNTYPSHYTYWCSFCVHLFVFFVSSLFCWSFVLFFVVAVRLLLFLFFFLFLEMGVGGGNYVQKN